MPIDKTLNYCYTCEFPSTPAFIANISNMLAKIVADGGKSPSLITEYDDNDPPEITGYKLSPQIGTVSNSSKELFNFELPLRMTATELVAYLEEPMVNPKPPITVHDIRSKFAIINVGTEEEPDYQREVIEQMVRTDVMNFFRFQDYLPDGTPDGPPRPPQDGDILSFSHYSGGMLIQV